MPYRLSLQVFTDSRWQDAAILTFTHPKKIDTARCTIGYDHTYLIEHLDALDTPFSPSVAVCNRLGWNSQHSVGFPAFIYDLLPSGAARKSLLKRFGHERPEDLALDLFLLERCTPAPIGHLRIKESVAHLGESDVAFPRAEVVTRTNTFLEYAYEQGAAIGGATGAGGEAPKLLLAEDAAGELHADATLADEKVCRHWLVKFARNQAGERDREILRAEYHYYRAINQLGLDTIPADGLALEEDEKPSLWMPRFDRRVVDGQVKRIAAESVYSICNNVQPGSHMAHEQVVARLVELWIEAGQKADVEDLVFEYVRRDLLNRLLGNSDNHGRNTSILRHADRLTLAPIYDLAPMVLDPEGITRVTKWKDERLGEPQWRAVCDALAPFAPADITFERLRDAARSFLALPDLLLDLPPAIRKADNRLPVLKAAASLKAWGLL